MPDPFASMTATALDSLGVDATVQRGAGPAVAVRVSVRDDLDPFGEIGRVAGRVRVVGFDKTVWQPRRGDIVTLDGASRAVESIVSDDGYLVEVTLDA